MENLDGSAMGAYDNEACVGYSYKETTGERRKSENGINMSVKFKKGNEAIATISGAVFDGEDTESADKEDAVEKKYRTRNLLTAMILMGVVMVGGSVHHDAYGQWLYFRFQKQVFGANYSQLNISAVKSPCLQKNTSVENPHKEQLNEAQELSSQFQTYEQLFGILPSLVSNIFFGAYADFIGRRAFFIVPVSGMLFKIFISWLVCYSELNVYIVLSGQFVAGACGSFGMLFMALYVYTADNTSQKKSRSLPMVIVGSVSHALSSLSHVAVGHGIAAFGFMWPMAAACVLVLSGLLGFIFFLRETLPKERRREYDSLLKGLKSLFSFYYKKSRDPEHKRIDFILLLAVIITFSASFGARGMRTLYLLNEPFCWNSKIIGNMETIKGLIGTVVSITFIKLLTKFMSDEVILLTKLVFDVAFNFTFSVAVLDWMIYLGLGLGIMGEAAFALVRSIMSRMVPATRRGALFASIAVSQNVIINVSSACLTYTYSRTVNVWKGLTYFVQSMIGVVPVILVIVILIMKKRRGATTATTHNTAL